MSNYPKYVIVSPVRDEERYIEQTIRSVVQQTIQPAEWIIVDDGSKDATGKIIEKYKDRHSWIKVVHRDDRGQRIPGAGVVETFYDGYNRLAVEDWEYIVKLDGDVGLKPDYFEKCFERFAQNPKLGMCGGVMHCLKRGALVPEVNPAFHVRGPIKLYKRACWDGIGGLVRAAGWDTVDEVQANKLGWRTRSFADLEVIHQRPTGAEQGFWRDGIKMGRAAHFSGYHPAFMLAKCLKRFFQRPYVVMALAHGWGFVGACLKGSPRVADKSLIRYIRDQQLRRLFFLESIWK
jgi:glycosyltransferase involved in cell wall biosynthesis